MNPDELECPICGLRITNEMLKLYWLAEALDTNVKNIEIITNKCPRCGLASLT